MKTFFKILECRFLVESTKIKNIISIKTALSEGNVKTNRIGSTKWFEYAEFNGDVKFFSFDFKYLFWAYLVRKLKIAFSSGT